MSADTITGVVVLQKLMLAPSYRLWFQYTRADGLVGHSRIPIKPKGFPKPTDYEGPVWDFVRDNPWLHCSPSVRILGPHSGAPDHFHNSGQWSNHYVEMAKAFGSEPTAGAICMELGAAKTKEERDRIIFEYRARGILL